MSDETRSNGLKALKTVGKNTVAVIKKIESKIYTESEGDDEAYNTMILQVIGDIIQGVSSVRILRNLTHGKVMWKHPSFDSTESMLKERHDFITKPYEVEEGVLQCRALLKKGDRKGEVCGSWKTFSFEKQTRSADEPMSVFAQCVACGNNWTYSG